MVSATLYALGGGCAAETSTAVDDDQESFADVCFASDAHFELAMRHDLISAPERGQETTGSFLMPDAVYDVSVESYIETDGVPVCDLVVTRNTFQNGTYAATLRVQREQGGAHFVVVEWRQTMQNRFSTVETTGSGAAAIASTWPGNEVGDITLSDSQFETHTVTTYFGRLPVERHSHPEPWDTQLHFTADYPEDGSVRWSLPGCYSPERTLAAFAGIYCEHALSRLGY